MKWLLPLLALTLSACTGLAGEVTIIATATPAVTPNPVGEDRGFPIAPPDLTVGQQLFIRSCTACHAPDGSGQGELVQGGQVPAMQSFLDAAAVRVQAPSDFFNIITNGNLENLMPPWRDALTEQQRWDVAHYALFMHYTDEQLRRGAELYAQLCPDCRTADGQGEGAPVIEIDQRPYNVTYPRDMAFISDAELVGAMREGRGEGVPVLDASISDEDAFAIAAYMRTFTTTRSDPAALPTATPVFREEAFDIVGQVSNGTTGVRAPEGLRVFLNFGSPAEGITTRETLVDASGQYRFVDVPRLPDSAYYVYTVYSTVTFDAPVQTSENIGAVLELPITIYETSDDHALIRLTALETVMEPFPQMETEGPSLGEGLLVSQRFTFENSGDRAFVLSQAGRTFSVLLMMPPGSIALNAANDRRFIVAPEQYSAIYAMGLPPGTTHIDLIYFWPYEDGAVFDQTLNYTLDATFRLTIAPKSIRLAHPEGWAVDTSAPFVNRYERPLRVERGGSLVFELQGAVDWTVATPGAVTGDVLLPLLLLAAGVLAVIVAMVVVLRRRAAPRTELLLQQIARLDALHELGQINHDAWQRQRKVLRDQLALLMAAQKPVDSPPG